MKRSIRILLLLPLLGAGCSESLPAHFDQIEGIYFNNQQNNGLLIDTASYTFIYEDADQMEVPVRIQQLGRMSQTPRAVNLRVTSPDAVEGVDYDLSGEALLPANANSFDYLITLYRTEALKSETKHLVVELAPNDSFILPFTEQIQSGDTVSTVRYTIYFSDQFTAPPAGWQTIFIGAFSQQKFELICEVMQIARADFNEEGVISSAKWMYIQSTMINYVSTQERLRDAGQPYDERAFDESGAPLTFV